MTKKFFKYMCRLASVASLLMNGVSYSAEEVATAAPAEVPAGDPAPEVVAAPVEAAAPATPATAPAAEAPTVEAPKTPAFQRGRFHPLPAIRDSSPEQDTEIRFYVCQFRFIYSQNTEPEYAILITVPNVDLIAGNRLGHIKGKKFLLCQEGNVLQTLEVNIKRRRTKEEFSRGFVEEGSEVIDNRSSGQGFAIFRKQEIKLGRNRCYQLASEAWLNLTQPRREVRELKDLKAFIRNSNFMQALFENPEIVNNGDIAFEDLMNQAKKIGEALRNGQNQKAPAKKGSRK